MCGIRSADGQVKIRGFRIELGEIDTYLSQHSLVKENVTLLRRNKDEEPTIVSYFVIDLAKWPQWLQTKGLPDDTDDDSLVGMLKRFRPLRDDARASLRKKLPSYAVPSVRPHHTKLLFGILTDQCTGFHSPKENASNTELQG